MAIGDLPPCGQGLNACSAYRLARGLGPFGPCGLWMFPLPPPLEMCMTDSEPNENKLFFIFVSGKILKNCLSKNGQFFYFRLNFF